MAIAKDVSVPENFEISLNPHRYGFKLCPYCSGHGFYLKESDIANVCTECHGLGCIKEDEDEKTDDNDFIGFLNDEKPDNPIL